MDNLSAAQGTVSPFNSSVEVGLRALTVLTAAHPAAYGLQRLTILDYLVVHSDDVPGGPPGLHPKTPYRAGELLLRRGVLEEGLLLFQSRGLAEQRFAPAGVFYAATDSAATFLDVLSGRYVESLRDRAAWVVERFAPTDDDALSSHVDEWVGEWGAEFDHRSVLQEELT